MDRDYKKGDIYQLLLNNGTYAVPVWSEVVAADDISVDPQVTDIEVPERGVDLGHMHGKGDGLFSFTLLEDAGNDDVETLINGLLDDTNLIELAIARGDIAVTGVVFWRAECALFGSLSANQGEVASYDIEAKRHINSDYGFTRNVAT